MEASIMDGSNLKVIVGSQYKKCSIPPHSPGCFEQPLLRSYCALDALEKLVQSTRIDDFSFVHYDISEMACYV